MRAKWLTAIVGTSVLALLMAGCTAPSDEPRDDTSKLVIYSAEEVLEDFAQRFHDQNPDIQVDVVLGSSGEGNARVIAEKDRPQGDISISGSDPAGANPELYLKTEGLVDLSRVAEHLLDPAGYAVPMMVFPVVYIYNSELLNGDAPPTTWEELADPKWKGRVYMGNPGTSEAAYKTLITWWSIGGWDLVERIAQNVIVTEGSQDGLRAVGNGEAAIGIGVENQVFKWADDERVVVVYPSDGVIMHVGTWFLIANSPSPTNAAKFMEFMLSAETQSYMAETYTGMRASVVDAAPAPGVPATSELNVIPFPSEATTDRAGFNDRWKDIITSIG